MTRHTLVVVLVVGILVALMAGQTPAPAVAVEQIALVSDPTPGPTGPMTGPIFGWTPRSEWSSAAARQMAVDAGVRWARTKVSWAALEPARGAINLSAMDGSFLEFQRLGIIPIVFIADNPAWAASTTCGPIDRVPISEFATFMRALAARYDGDADYDDDGDVDGPALPEVDYWDLYNEPDNRWVQYASFGGCWGNYGAEYAQLLAVAWDALHQANPNGQLGIGGLAAEPDALCDVAGCVGQKLFNTNVVKGVDNSTPITGLPADFVDDVLNYMVAHPGPTYFDFLDFHAYPAFSKNWDGVSPYNNALYGKAQHYKLRMEAKGFSRYLLASEIGRPSAAFKNYLGETDYEGNEWQSRAVVTMYAQAMRFGLRAVTWFSLSDIVEGQETYLWGLLNAGLQPKPSYDAYKTLTRQLGAASFSTKLASAPGAEVYVFNVPGVGVRSVVWASAIPYARYAVDVDFVGSTVYTVDKFGVSTVYHDGQAGDRDGSTNGAVRISISRSPIYVDGRPDVATTITPTATPSNTPIATATPSNTPIPAAPTKTQTVTEGPTATRTSTVTPTPRPAAVTITGVRFSPISLTSGDLLQVEIGVRNDTGITALTQGPAPGFTYNEGDTPNSRGYAEIGSRWRVGVDFTGRSASVKDHPYRWGLGADLAPGASVTVTGYIRLTTPRATTYWVGLVQETVRWWQDNIGAAAITVSAGPTPSPTLTATPTWTPTVTPTRTATPGSARLTITGVRFSPISLTSGDVLQVEIGVRNDADVTALTQGPAPGFTYNEGDTPNSRGYAEIGSRWRVGVDFTGRSSGVTDHPYRWGLGADLAPGASVTVTGYIRLTTPRATTYWVGLVQETVRWWQDNIGAAAIVVSAGPTPSPTLTATPTWTPTVTPTRTATPGSARLTITGVRFSPINLTSGDLLQVEIGVRNDTGVTALTQGPAPGFTYNEGDTPNSRGYAEIGSRWRVGVDFTGRSASVKDHPYRWGLGADLAPGASVTVTGYIRLTTPRATTYWVGLVQETVRWWQDNIGAAAIVVSAGPTPSPTLTATPTWTPTVTPTRTATPGSARLTITGVRFSPINLTSGDVLQVEIGVRNTGTAAAVTQGPPPGFAYGEADTPNSLGYPGSQGRWRVGVDFTGRRFTVTDHPYRWGLGADLAPGASVTVTGYITLTTARTTSYWVGLVEEHVRWWQDKVGTATITVGAASSAIGLVFPGAGSTTVAGVNQCTLDDIWVDAW